MRKIYDMGNGEFLTEDEALRIVEKKTQEYRERLEEYIENPAPAPVGMKSLIDRVLEQIVKDVESGDLTAIEELLLVGVPDVQHLQAFIGEE